MAEDYLVRFLDDANVAQDLAIITDPEGDNHLGVTTRHVLIPEHHSVFSVPVNDTETIYQHTVTGSPLRIRKIVATGDTDGFFKLYIGSDVVAMGKIGPIIRDFKEDFCGGVLYVSVDSVVRLDVTNTGVITSSFEAIIYKGD